MAKKIGRNDPCLCGSQRKFKHCCFGKGLRIHRGKYALYLLFFSCVVAASILAAYKSWNERSRTGQSSEVSATKNFQPLLGARFPSEGSATKGSLTLQPPGPVPEGKVWSSEHGHWHDAPGANVASEGSDTKSGLYPQPPGPVPEGKVWFPEHGHWHDAALEGAKAQRAVNQASSASTNSLDQQPLDTEPDEKVRSGEQGDLLEAVFELEVAKGKARHAAKALYPVSSGPAE